MREEQQPGPVAPTRDPRHEIGALGHARVELAGDAVLLEVGAEQVRRGGLVARRIHGVEADELLEEPGHLVAEAHLRVPRTNRYSPGSRTPSPSRCASRCSTKSRWKASRWSGSRFSA